MKLSVIIPAYKDPYIYKTIDSLLESSGLGDDIEIIPVIDGEWLEKPLQIDSRLKPIYLPKNKGMRNAINEGIKKSTGEYIMKCDAHCSFDKNYDIILTRDCKRDWLMIPRRYSLREDKYTRDRSRPKRDFHFISFPIKIKTGYQFSVQDWYKPGDKTRPIEDTMIMQGSCWVANKEYFMEKVGLLDDNPEHYGTFAQEHIEIGLKYWLKGGAIKVNKNTWYAHLSKMPRHYHTGKYERRYKASITTSNNNVWGTEHWIKNKEPDLIHDFKWLIKKFNPVPSWNDNWEQEIKNIYG